MASEKTTAYGEKSQGLSAGISPLAPATTTKASNSDGMVAGLQGSMNTKNDTRVSYDAEDSGSVKHDYTHRMLRPRHIQLIGIGGTIGTALYVQIGRGLLNGGPGSLFIAFTLW